MRSRPITAAVGYVTGPASHFIHSQLKEAVWKHPYVLKDSLELIRIVEGMSFGACEHIMLTAADVGIAFCAKPALNEVADVVILKRDLREVLNYL